MRKSLLALAVMILSAPQPALAGNLGKPAGPAVLEVTGRITNANDGDRAVFDLAMLDRLASHTTTTSAPWYDGTRTFAGPLGKAVLRAVGADGTTLKVTTLDNYVTEIPVSDFTDHRVVLATTIDGKPMTARDKGPVFIVYPFDEEPALDNETYYSRSVSRVRSIEVE